jgi:hypothetical protein
MNGGFRNVMPVGFDAPLPSKEEWEKKDVASGVAVGVRVGVADAHSRDLVDDGGTLTVEQAKMLAKLLVLYPWLDKLL